MNQYNPILSIDDDAPVRAIVKEVLEFEGFDVLEACNGEEGLRLAKLHPVGLIICDCNMPVMDGFTTLEKLRSTPEIAHVPFVFLTGQPDSACFAKARELGISGILRKPISFSELSQVALSIYNREVAQ